MHWFWCKGEVQCALNSVQRAMFLVTDGPVQCALCNVQSAACKVQRAACIVSGGRGGQ